MAEKKGKTPPTEPEPKEPGAEPEGEPKVEPEPEPYEPPERFQGKKLEDVIKMYEEAEKEKDRSGTEVGKLRGEVDDIKNTASYYQNMAQDLQRKAEKGGGKPEGEATPDLTGFYDNPLPLMQKVIQGELKKDRETREKTEGDREVQRASMNFATGRSKSMEGNPDLFRGIEKRIEEGMWQYYKSGRVSADELRDPETWENGARIIHMANKDWDRIAPPKIVPLSPTETEKPGTAKKTSEEEVPRLELDAFGEEMREHAIKGGMDEKDFNKLVQETKKREGR
jgi:hypothetical protein